MEKREQNPRHASCRHATERIFTMRQIVWAPSRGWLASCSCDVHQVESIWHHHWMGWQNWRRPSQELLTRVCKEDLAWGRWFVDGQALSIWVDASSLATGMLLIYDGAVVEDACWLRSAKDSQHINLAELDAIIKGINLAILWKMTTLHLFTDSACVHKWISDTITDKARVWTKATSEMLIRRWLDTIIKLVKEYTLSMNVSLVKSSQNKADRLTRVPKRWLDAIKRNTGPVQPACTASVSSVGLDQIKVVHWQSGHPGVQRTLYFVKQIAPEVSKATVKAVVRECEECQSIDPASMHWSKGALNVKQTWHW